MIAVVLASLLGGSVHGFERLFARYGYPLMAVLIAGESFSFPLPGELSLLGGALEAEHGHMSLLWVIVVGSAAAIVGDNLAYLFGEHAGRRLIERLGHLLHVRDRHLRMLDHYFDNHAGKTIVTARWISPIRGWTALSAGASRLSWPRFFVFNAIGSVTWATGVTLLAFLFARHIEGLADFLGIGALLALGVAVAIGATLYVRHRRRRAQEQRAHRVA